MWHKNDEILRHTRAQQRRQPGDEIPKAPGAHRIEGMNNNSAHSSGTQNSRGTQNSSGNTTRSSSQPQQQQYGRVTPPPPSPSSSNGRRCLHEQEQEEDFNPYPLRYESYQPPRSFATTRTSSINTSATSGSTPTTTASEPVSPTVGAAPPPRHVRPRHQQQRKNLHDLEEEHSRSPKRSTAGGGSCSGGGKNYHPHQYHQDDHHQKPNTTSSEEGNKYIHHHDDLVAGTAEIDAAVTATAHHHHAATQPDGSGGITDSFINRQRNAGINIVEATLVENEDEIASKMKQKEEELLQRLAAKDAELKAKDAELRRVQQEREQQQRRSTQQQQQQAPAAGLGGGAGVTFAPGTTTHRKTPSHHGGGGETSSASSELSMDRAEFMRNRILQRDEVKLGRVISTGSFNSVYNIKSIKLDEQSYRWVPREHIQQRQHIVEMAKHTKLAFKSLDPNLDPKKRPLASKRLLYEAKLLITKLNDHPNIIKILGTASQDVADTNFFFIIPKSDYTLYDAINGGNKWNKRQKGKPKFLFSTQVKAAIDIASGLDHLHSLNIMCSDLKPENIGYTMESNSWKLCNLSKAQSLARKAKSRGMGGHQRQQPAMKPYNMDLRTSSLYHGTPPYAAPEISEKIPCNIAIDTFSFAIVLWEITSVRLCFGRESKTLSALTSVVVDEATSGAKWQRPGFDKDAPKALQEIIQQCWEDDPRYRPYMKDVLSKLKFFQETLSAVL